MKLQETYQNGLLRTIESRVGVVDFSCDDVVIITNRNTIRLSETEPIRRGEGDVFLFPDAEVLIQYQKITDETFLQRKISVSFPEETTILKIGVRIPQAEERFVYDTFYLASAACFCREKGLGLICGFENPYVQLDGDFLYYEPSWMLKAGECFESDLNFYGLCPLAGDLIAPQLNRSQLHFNGRNHPRYRNPSEGQPLYRSEIRAFHRYTAQYFGCEQKPFQFMTYDFFGNLPQRPDNEEQVSLYIEHIDSVCEIGCDTILLNPLYPNRIPDGSEDSFWELFPEGTYAEKILNYARKKGLKIGMYTGTAGNGCYGNSSMIPYADIPQWKKTDRKGNISGENCLAEDSFVDWFIRVQINTIKKYHLDVWAWDPGPGNGFFCYNQTHGHFPGKGGYKGFRNSLRVMKEIKEAVPGLYYQGFHGNKEYGLWGFRYIDQHEAYWENEVYTMNPIYDDVSVDRVTADNIRQQAIWNDYFRFMPATMNHGIANRMIQANWMHMYDLDKVFDYIGWQYALLSSVAYGGPVTLTILPRNPEKIKGMKEFYRKWIDFAKEIFPYSRNTIPFGSQVGCGIDAVSKLVSNEGYLFFFNPFPEDYVYSWTADWQSGFTEGNDTLYYNMIYPFSRFVGTTCYGAESSLTIPAYGCVVIKVSKKDEQLASEETLSALPRVIARDTDGDFKFFADGRMKEELGRYEITEEEIGIQAHYANTFSRVNSCWARPDRLWLLISPKESADGLKIHINNQEIAWQRDFLQHNEMRAENMIFADITDFICWEKENQIQLCGLECETVYLHYPKPQNEELPVTKKRYERKFAFAPCLDESIQILSASLNRDNLMYPNSENTLTVSVNLPPEALEGVYASVPISIGDTGYELKHDMVLEYKDGVWCKTFRSGERIHLIIDDEKFSVWAVSKQNRESKAYHLAFDWLLN